MSNVELQHLYLQEKDILNTYTTNEMTGTEYCWPTYYIQDYNWTQLVLSTHPDGH